MRIREIRLQPFRNFQEIRLSLEADRVLIEGGNGLGKSNLLEAISYLSLGKSVRGAKDRNAVPHTKSFFDIQGLCNDGQRDAQLRVYYNADGGKKAFRNEVPFAQISEVVGLFRTVHFSPEDVSLVLRFPGQRRRLLDILVSQSSATYLQHLQRYNRTLAQRNHLLRNNKRHGPPDDAMQAWNGQLAHEGGSIRAERLAALEELAPDFNSYYAPMGSEEEHAAIEYRGAHGSSEEELRAELLEELEAKRNQEISQGHTACGPHRDDVAFLLNGHAADAFASEGQLKTMLVAWKMAEAKFLERRTDQQPVLLLDDVLSELDAERGAKLMEAVVEFEQVILTSPRAMTQATSFESIKLG